MRAERDRRAAEGAASGASPPGAAGGTKKSGSPGVFERLGKYLGGVTSGFGAKAAEVVDSAVGAAAEGVASGWAAIERFSTSKFGKKAEL